MTEHTRHIRTSGAPKQRWRRTSDRRTRAQIFMVGAGRHRGSFRISHYCPSHELRHVRRYSPHGDLSFAWTSENSRSNSVHATKMRPQG